MVRMHADTARMHADMAGMGWMLTLIHEEEVADVAPHAAYTVCDVAVTDMCRCICAPFDMATRRRSHLQVLCMPIV